MGPNNKLTVTDVVPYAQVITIHGDLVSCLDSPASGRGRIRNPRDGDTATVLGGEASREVRPDRRRLVGGQLAAAGHWKCLVPLPRLGGARRRNLDLLRSGELLSWYMIFQVRSAILALYVCGW